MIQPELPKIRNDSERRLCLYRAVDYATSLMLWQAGLASQSVSELKDDPSTPANGQGPRRGADAHHVLFTIPPPCYGCV